MIDEYIKTVLKREYNSIVPSFRKMMAYMGNPLVDISEKEKHVDRGAEIMKKLDALLTLIGSHTEDELWNGFTIEEVKSCENVGNVEK